MKPTAQIVIPFFAFALGTGIKLDAVAKGGLSGVLVGLIVAPFTGFLVYLGYKLILRRGRRSGEEIARIDEMELGFSEPKL
jgi:2-keto-3-deoxygluconate permease